MAANMTFKPVRTRQTIQDQVYDQLREALVSGAFEAGESFTISALAEKFMTSHMPVREALRRLAAENALRISSTGTAIVPWLDVTELRQICQARLILEPATAAIAFPLIDADVLRDPNEILPRHTSSADSGDIETMLDANRAFHFRIYRASGNEVLFSQIENLWLRSGPYVRYLSDRMGEMLRSGQKTVFTSRHGDMIDAIHAKDAAAFEQAMHADISATHELLFDLLSSGTT